jgi:hypothetical protein
MNEAEPTPRVAKMRRRLLPFLLTAFTLGAAPAAHRGDPIFRAIALLERRPPGAPPRVRFEWSLRSGAVEYLLTGSWTARNSWTVQSREYRVTRANATTWDDRQITFEVSLPVGNHSWKLVPVRQPNGPGDPSAVTQIGFDLQ